MKTNAEEPEIDAAFLAVWRQSLLEGKKEVALDGVTYPARATAKHGFLQIDFETAGQTYRGLEQNPRTKSRWAELARRGAQVMQFLCAGRYLAVVVDGKIIRYSRGR